jgi:sugar lactone lactonase YvrE
MKRVRRLFTAALVMGVPWITASVPAFASDRPSQPTQVQILVHLDISTKQQIESLAREPDGSLDASFIFDGQLARISLAGQVSILATLPKPASGPSLAAGIARDHDGNLYVLYSAGSTALNGVWRLSPNGTLGRIVAMPADAELNGMTLDEQTHNMYFVDSLKGAVYQAPIGGGIARVWAQTPELARLTFLGANGVHVRERAIWVSNTDQGTVVRFPIKGDGTAGSPTIVDNGLVGIDDFAFLSDGEIVAAMNAPNKVVLIGRHGSIMTLADSANGTENPTTVLIRGRDIYVANGAYHTGVDPNLMLIRLNQGNG